MAAYNATVASANLPQNVSTAASVPPRMLRLFALYENLLRFVMPLCSALPRPHLETPIVSSNNIVDVSGVGLKQFWNLKGHMQDASVLATAHYPETLDRIFVRLRLSLLGTCVLGRYLLTSTDHRRAILLPYRVELDQKMVRPRHHFQDIHPVCCRGEAHP